MALTDWLADLKLRLGVPPRVRTRRYFQERTALPAQIQVLEQRQLLSVNAVADNYTVANSGPAPTPVQLNVLANDTTNPVGQTISITSAFGAMHGSVQVQHTAGQPDTILYTPYVGYMGPDSFSYTDMTPDNSTATGMVMLNVTSAGTAPTINPIASQTTQENMPVSLPLTINNPSAAPLTVTVTNLPQGLMYDANTNQITGMPMTGDATGPNHGLYSVTVTASNMYGNATPVTFTWTVMAAGTAPVITTPASQTTLEGSAIAPIPLTISNPGNTPLTVNVNGLPPGLMYNQSTGQITGMPTVGDATGPGHGLYNVMITATNSYGTSSSSFNWTVTPAGSAPVITPPANPSTVEGTAIAPVPLTISNPGNSPLTVNVMGLPTGLTYNQSTGQITGTPTIGDATGPQHGLYAVMVTATNSYGTSSINFNWTVTSAGSAPVITVPPSQSTQENVSVALPLAISNPGNTPLTVNVTGLPPGLVYNSATNQITGTATIGDATGPGQGLYVVMIMATNNYGTSSSSFNWTITPAGTAPVITPPANPSTVEGTAIAPVTLTISNPGNTPLTVTVSGLPAGLAYDPAMNQITGTPTLGDAVGPSHGLYTVMVTATNTYGTTTSSFTWTVTPAGTAPVITVPPSQTSQEGSAIAALPLAISNPGGTTLTVTVNGLPAGLSYNPATGQIAGTPTAGDAVGPSQGLYSVMVIATNAYGTTSNSFCWTVSAQRPTITSPGNQTSLDGANVSVAVSAFDPAGYNLMYAATGLPQGLSINPQTGLITGTITPGAAAQGPYSVTVTATNLAGASATAAFTWSVSAANLVATAPGNQTSREGTAVAIFLSVTNPGGYPLTYSAANLPPGLSIDGQGQITGTISAGDAVSGLYNVSVTISNAYGGSATANFVWTVSAQNPVVTSPPNQSSAEDHDVSLSVAATDPGNYPLTYTASGLPEGLTIDAATGAITGTLADGDAAHGPYQVTVTASDGYGGSASTEFTWTVTAENTVIAVLGNQTVTEGSAVALPVQATDPAGYALTYAATGLPPGLSIDAATGLISGTVANGAANHDPYLVTLTASDEFGGSATTSFVWSVVGLTPPQITGLSVQTGDIAGGTSVTITGTNFNQVTSVMFGSTPATSFVVNSPTSITAVAPSHDPGLVTVTVLTTLGMSNPGSSSQFTYQAAASVPTVTSVSPGTATTTGGATITISGTNFTGVTGVSFGGVAATSFTVVSATTITAVAPVHVSGQVDVQVTTAAGMSATNPHDSLTFLMPVLPPVVTGLSASSGTTAGGASVTIQGINFTEVTGVWFGNQLATSFTVNSPTSITAVTPAMPAGPVDVTVTNSAGVSAAGMLDRYTFQSSLPTITNLSVTTGSLQGGASVVITGQNLQNVSQVMFGDQAAANFIIMTPTSILAYAPTRQTAGTVDITVTTLQGTSATSAVDRFTYVDTSGTGSGGGSSGGGSGDGGAGDGSTTISGSLPYIDGLSVSSGSTAGGTNVTLYGVGFSPVTGVMFGDTAADSFQINSDNSITAIAPVASQAGTVAVTLQTSQGTTAANDNAEFTYADAGPPTITGGTATGTTAGSLIQFTGTGFTGTTAVSLGGAAANFVVQSDTTLFAIIPADANSDAIDITTPNGTLTVSAGLTLGGQPSPNAASGGNNSGGNNGGNSGNSSANPLVNVTSNAVPIPPANPNAPTGPAGMPLSLAMSHPGDYVLGLVPPTPFALPFVAGMVGIGGWGDYPRSLPGDPTNPPVNHPVTTMTNTNVTVNGVTMPFPVMWTTDGGTIAEPIASAANWSYQNYDGSIVTNTGSGTIQFSLDTGMDQNGSHYYLTEIINDTFSETLQAADGTGYTVLTTVQETYSYRRDTPLSGPANLSINELTQTTTSEQEYGLLPLNDGNGYGIISTQITDTQQSSLSAQTSSGTVTGNVNSSDQGQESYSESDTTIDAMTMPNGSTSSTDSDTFTGQDQWQSSSSGTFSLANQIDQYNYNTRSANVTSSSSSNGSDVYSDNGQSNSTNSSPDVGTVSGTTLTTETSTSTDSGSDSYSNTSQKAVTYSHQASDPTPYDTVTIQSDTHNDTDNGNENIYSASSGSITQNETLADGSTVTGSYTFGSTDSDPITYQDSDTLSQGSPDTINEHDTSDDQTNSQGNGSTTIVTPNADGTTTTITFSDQSQDTAEDDAHDTLNETENPGDNNFTFDVGDHITDSGSDSQSIRISTTGTTAAGATVNSLEVITYGDQYQDDELDDDPGTEDDYSSGQDTESDTTTETTTDHDTVLLGDVFNSTVTTPQSDGSIVTTTTHEDDSENDDIDYDDAFIDVETAHNDPNAPLGVDEVDHATNNSTYRDTINSLIDNFSQQTSITLPGNQGTISYGSTNAFNLTNGYLSEVISDTKDVDTANSAGDDESETDDVSMDLDDTDTSGDSFNYNVTDPTTGVQTQITATDSLTDTEHTDETNDETLTVTPVTGSPGNFTGGTSDVEDDSGDDSDSYTGNSNFQFSITGSPTPGVTVNISEMLTDITHGGSHDHWTDDFPSDGNDTGHVDFGSDDHDTETGGGSATISNVSYTSDGLGNSTSTNETSTIGNTIAGNIDDQDNNGTEDWSDTNGQLTSDTESDTETDVSNVQIAKNVTTNANDVITTLDPSTGITTTETYLDNGSTHNTSETDGDTTTDVHTAGMAIPAGIAGAFDTITQSPTRAYSTSDNWNTIDTFHRVGTDAWGFQYNFTETDTDTTSRSLSVNSSETVDPSGNIINPTVGGSQSDNPGFTSTSTGTITPPANSGGGGGGNGGGGGGGGGGNGGGGGGAASAAASANGAGGASAPSAAQNSSTPAPMSSHLYVLGSLYINNALLGDTLIGWPDSTQTTVERKIGDGSKWKAQISDLSTFVDANWDIVKNWGAADWDTYFKLTGTHVTPFRKTDGQENQADLLRQSPDTAALGNEVAKRALEAGEIMVPIAGLQGGLQGLGTGLKAVANGITSTIVSTVTLGLVSDVELIPVTDADRAAGYDTAVAIASSAGQVLVGVMTGGAACAGGRIASIGGVLSIVDTAGHVVGVVKAGYDMAENGINSGNAAQFGTSAFMLVMKSRMKCFAAGTQVVVATDCIDGRWQYKTVAIETLKEGNLVLAREEHGPLVKLQRIEETFIRVSDHLRVLTFEDCSGRQQTIKTTDEHPFWSHGQATYILAGALAIGTKVVGPNEELQSLIESSREEFQCGVLVYNFRVSEYHTYFVAQEIDATPLLVHNTCYSAKNPKKIPVDGAGNSAGSAQHLIDSDSVGKPLQVNRGGVTSNRRDALKGKAKVPGHDLDEAPPAVLRKAGDPVSVRPIPSGDNRSAGAQIGNGLRGVKDGDYVQIEVVPKLKKKK